MKQKLSVFGVIILALGLLSCSKTKEITVSNVKIEGEDADVFKVENGNYTLNGKEGLSIGIKIELLNTLGKVEEVDLGDKKLALQILDKDGENVSGALLQLTENEQQKLIEFVQGKNGSTMELTFKEKEPEDVSKILKQADSFKLINVTCHPKHIPFHKGPIKIEGQAGGAPYTMVLKYKDGIVYGIYYYNKVGPAGKIDLKGEYDDNHLKMAEYINGYVSYWNMIYRPDDNSFTGKFTRFDGKEFMPTMKITGNTTYEGKIPDFFLSDNAFDSDYFNDEPADGYSNLTDSDNVGQNWDEWLDAYEAAVNRLISIYKKAKNGDAAALTEYNKYLLDVQELVKEGENVKGSMTSSQLKRYQSITNKVAQLN